MTLCSLKCSAGEAPDGCLSCGHHSDPPANTEIGQRRESRHLTNTENLQASPAGVTAGRLIGVSDCQEEEFWMGDPPEGQEGALNSLRGLPGVSWMSLGVTSTTSRFPRSIWSFQSRQVIDDESRLQGYTRNKIAVTTR